MGNPRGPGPRAPGYRHPGFVLLPPPVPTRSLPFPPSPVVRLLSRCPRPATPDRTTYSAVQQTEQNGHSLARFNAFAASIPSLLLAASPSPQRSSTLISPCHAPSIVPLAWCRCGRFFGVFLGMHGFVFAVWECLLNAVRSGEIVTLHLDGGGEFRESARVWRVLSGCSGTLKEFGR